MLRIIPAVRLCFDCLVMAGPFFVADALMQDQPDQPTLSMGYSSDGFGYVPDAGTERRYTISKMLPLVLENRME